MIAKVNKDLDLTELKKVLGFKHVTYVYELSNVFDLQKLDADGTPEIITKKKTVIIFDNSDFNSVYIIDMVNEYFMEQKYPENVCIDDIDFLYVDDPQIRRALFHPDCNVVDPIKLETEILHAGIMVINPVKKHIVTFMETQLSTVDEIIIYGGLNWLWSEAADIKVLGK